MSSQLCVMLTYKSKRVVISAETNGLCDQQQQMLKEEYKKCSDFSWKPSPSLQHLWLSNTLIHK